MHCFLVRECHLCEGSYCFATSFSACCRETPGLYKSNIDCSIFPSTLSARYLATCLSASASNCFATLTITAFQPLVNKIFFPSLEHASIIQAAVAVLSALGSPCIRVIRLVKLEQTLSLVRCLYDIVHVHVQTPR